MIRRACIAALTLLLGGSTAEARIAPKDASYFCVAEIAGGLRYNERTKKMESATFKPDAKFVMRMKHLRSERRRLSWQRRTCTGLRCDNNPGWRKGRRDVFDA